MLISSIMEVDHEPNERLKILFLPMNATYRYFREYPKTDTLVENTMQNLTVFFCLQLHIYPQHKQNIIC